MRVHQNMKYPLASWQRLNKCQVCNEEDINKCKWCVELIQKEVQA